MMPDSFRKGSVDIQGEVLGQLNEPSTDKGPMFTSNLINAFSGQDRRRKDSAIPSFGKFGNNWEPPKDSGMFNS